MKMDCGKEPECWGHGRGSSGKEGFHLVMDEKENLTITIL